MKRLCISIFVCALCLVLQAGAQEAVTKPQYQRMLQGEDAKRATEMEMKISILTAGGHSDEAVKLTETLLSLRLRLQGADHWEVQNTKNALADLRRPLTEQQTLQLAQTRKLAGQVRALFQQGQYREALSTAEEIVRIKRETLGKEHSDTGISLNNLALLHYSLGSYSKAEPLYQAALRISQKNQGKDHPDTATSLNNLAALYKLQGAYSNAEPLLQDALRIYRDAMGENHPDTAVCLNNLASLLDSQGDYAKAEVLYQDALRINREVLGKEHPTTAVSLNNLAGLYIKQGAYTKAEPLYQHALRINEEALGAKHPATATSLSNLAVMYYSQGAYAKAEPLFEDSLRRMRGTLGANHPATAGCLNNLAMLYQSQRLISKAETCLQDALRIRREALGKTHPDTANSLNNLALLYYSLGAYDKAEPLYQDAVSIRRKAIGAKHPDTATSLLNLAALYSSQKAYAQAKPLYQDALAICQESLGEWHPHTAESLQNLANFYHKQGEFLNAEPLLIEAARAYEASRLIAAKGIGRAVTTGGKSPYSSQSANCAALCKKREAYTALELDLARGLLDEQANRRRSALTPEEQRQALALAERLSPLDHRMLALATLKEQSAAEQEELVSLLAERRELEGELTKLAVALCQREVASLDTIQAALPANGALIVWLDAEHLSTTWGCVVRASEEPHWERLPGTGDKGEWTKADGELAAKLVAALAAPGTLEVGPLVAKLQAQRLAPLAKHLLGVKHLYAVPVRGMAGVPVEVLSGDYTVSYVPSGTFLSGLQKQARPEGQSLLALGDPIFTTADAEQVPPNTTLPPEGLLITQVAPDGAAAKARLKAGDVLVRYGEVELTSVDKLTAAIEAQVSAKEVEVLVWREGEEKPLTRTVVPGKLGVVLSKEPAREAIANRRKTNAMLLILRGGDWRELPGTRAEVSQLARLFGVGTTKLFDSTASEQALDGLRKSHDLAKYRYLHFATHGEANNAMALQSTLILAQDALPKDALPTVGEPYIDGKLSASEVLEYWQLDAELVTLSACETALGPKGGGDGLLGFAQAFLAAGARSVCLSLWKVDDAATALLMQRFYQNLLGRRPGLEKPMGKAAALAEAKNWLRNLTSEDALKLTAEITKGVVRGKNQKALPLVEVPKAPDPATAANFKPYSHPKYWAAFILIGDPD